MSRRAPSPETPPATQKVRHAEPDQADWVRFRSADLHSICRSDLENELRAIYERHPWVYDSLAADPDVRFFRGRRPVVPGVIGKARLVVKRMHHGGMLAPLFRDFFFTARRARSHVDLAGYLTAHGVATAPVAFVSWRRVRGLVRCEVGFTRIEGGRDADVFFFGEGTPPSGWETQAAKIGGLVARLHQIGFVHGDLNLMNFLFGPEGEPYILDLDKSALHNGSLSERRRAGNLARLERSIRKQGRHHAPQLAEQIIARIRDAYASVFLTVFRRPPASLEIARGVDETDVGKGLREVSEKPARRG